MAKEMVDSAPLPRVLYVAPANQLEPYLGDFAEEANGRYVISVYDVDAPPRDQFVRVDAVVEHGGGYATSEMLDAGAAAGVRLWQITATGLDHIDLDAYRSRGIRVSNMPGIRSTAIPMAEHALLLMLAHAKRLIPSQQSLAEGRLYEPMTCELHGKTVAIVGLGASGRELSKRCVTMGMRVLAVDEIPLPAEEQARLGLDFFGGRDDLDRILPEADFVSIHVPLTAETRGLLDERRLGLMKKTAVLINVARGAVVDEDALVRAVLERRIGGAGLDVFSQEPVRADHPLLAQDTVVATPHNGVVSLELSQRRAALAVENIDRVIAGQPPLFELVRAV